METGGFDPQRYNPQHIVWEKLTHKAASEKRILTHSTNKAMGFYISHKKTCGNCWIYTKIHNAELNSWEAHWHTGMQPTFIVAISPSIPDTSYSIPCSFHFNWLCSIIIKIPPTWMVWSLWILKMSDAQCSCFGLQSIWLLFLLANFHHVWPDLLVKSPYLFVDKSQVKRLNNVNPELLLA